jgi:hypothetical protein
MNLSQSSRVQRLMRMRSVAALGVVALAVGVSGAGCSAGVGHAVVDGVVSTAYRPPALPLQAPPGSAYVLLSGDMHCHVAPPDWPPHVVRDLAETQRLAADEALDFVVLTPHVWARFFEDDALRERVASGQKKLREDIAALPPGRTTFIAGFEYTDGQYGHVGASFGDLDAVLGALPAAEARAHPEAFFERYVASGGVLVVNHPFTTPTNAIVSISKEDLSWRPFTSRGPFPPEIEAVRRLAQGYEAFNLTTSELRDHFLYFDRTRSIRQTLDRVDEEVLAQRRPLFPAGGSDSHSHSLRATTFLLAKGRTQADVREALLSGRTCIRAAIACTLEARVPGGAWASVGSRFQGASRVELRSQGAQLDVTRNAQPVAEGGTGEIVSVDTPPGQCSVIRAAVDNGWSAPVYVNCAF